MALVLRRKPKGWKIARTAYMIPNIIPTAATGVMFTLLLNPMFGIVKPVLDAHKEMLGMTAEINV